MENVFKNSDGSFYVDFFLQNFVSFLGDKVAFDHDNELVRLLRDALNGNVESTVAKKLADKIEDEPSDTKRGNMS